MAKKNSKKGSKSKDSARPGASGGMAKHIVPLVIIAGILGYIIYEVKIKPTDDPILMQQSTARGAMEAYIETAHAFRTRTPDFMAVQKTITKDDWDWFQANAEKIFQKQDFLNVTGAMDPSAAAAGARIIVMESLHAAGPNSDINEILSVKESGDNAVAVVRKVENYGGGGSTVEDISVKLVKEGKYWKVVDFAGGRALVEGRMGDVNIVFRDPDNLPASPAAPESASPIAPLNPNNGNGVTNPVLAPPSNQVAPQNAFNTGAPQNVAGINPQVAPNPTTGNVAANAAGNAPGTLAQADQAIIAASNAWNQGQFQAAIDQALIAYQIRLHFYGANDPRTQEVIKMGQAAQEMLAKTGAAGASPNGY